MRRHERAQIGAEVQSAWRDSGIEPKPNQHMPATPEDEWLKEQAIGIIHGELNRNALAALTSEQTEKLSMVTQELISLTTMTSIRELEFVNPRFSAFQAKVVKDTTTETDDLK
jgi:hypothetical protein